MEIKSNEPRLTQKEISRQLGFSDSTIKRYRDDINMDSPYNRKKYNRKNTKITETQTHKTKENTKNNENTKSIKKNDLKGGSALENNHQEDNTNFITIARKIVVNVKNFLSLNG